MDNILPFLEDYTTNAQKVKNVVLDRMLQDKAITKKQWDHYSNNMQVIIIKNNWFMRWFEKFRTKDETPEDYSFEYVDLGSYRTPPKPEIE